MVSSAHVVVEFVFGIGWSDHSLVCLVHFEVDVVGLQVAYDVEIVGLVAIVLSIWLSARVWPLRASTAIAHRLNTANRGLLSILTRGLVDGSIHWSEVVLDYDGLALSNLHKLLSSPQIASIFHISWGVVHEWGWHLISTVRGEQGILLSIELEVRVGRTVHLRVTRCQLVTWAYHVHLTLHVLYVVNGLAGAESW